MPIGARDREGKLCNLSLEAECVNDLRATHPLAAEILRALVFDELSSARDLKPAVVPTHPVADAPTSAALRAWGVRRRADRAARALPCIPSPCSPSSRSSSACPYGTSRSTCSAGCRVSSASRRRPEPSSSSLSSDRSRALSSAPACDPRAHHDLRGGLGAGQRALHLDLEAAPTAVLLGGVHHDYRRASREPQRDPCDALHVQRSRSSMGSTSKGSACMTSSSPNTPISSHRPPSLRLTTSVLASTSTIHIHFTPTCA